MSAPAWAVMMAAFLAFSCPVGTASMANVARFCLPHSSPCRLSSASEVGTKCDDFTMRTSRVCATAGGCRSARMPARPAAPPATTWRRVTKTREGVCSERGVVIPLLSLAWRRSRRRNHSVCIDLDERTVPDELIHAHERARRVLAFGPELRAHLVDVAQRERVHLGHVHAHAHDVVHGAALAGEDVPDVLQRLLRLLPHRPPRERVVRLHAHLAGDEQHDAFLEL